eukprot:EG_transcript_11335
MGQVSTQHKQTSGYIASFEHTKKEVDRVHSVSLSKNTKLLVTCSESDVKLWDLTSAKLLSSINPKGAPFYGVDISPDGSVVALACGKAKEVALWLHKEGSKVVSLKGHTDRIYSVVFTCSGSKLLSSSGDKTIKFWDTNRRFCEATFEGHELDVLCIAISIDGTFAVSGSSDHTLRVWDLKKREHSYTLSGHTAEVRCVAISPNGLNIISGGADFVIRLWHWRTGHLRGELNAEQQEICSLCFSSGGRWLISGGADGSLKVWDFQKGDLTDVFEGHCDHVSSLAAVADGSAMVQLVSGSWDGTIKFWPLREDGFVQGIIHKDAISATPLPEAKVTDFIHITLPEYSKKSVEKMKLQSPFPATAATDVPPATAPTFRGDVEAASMCILGDESNVCDEGQISKSLLRHQSSVPAEMGGLPVGGQPNTRVTDCAAAPLSPPDPAGPAVAAWIQAVAHSPLSALPAAAACHGTTAPHLH